MYTDGVTINSFLFFLQTCGSFFFFLQLFDGNACPPEALGWFSGLLKKKKKKSRLCPCESASRPYRPRYSDASLKMSREGFNSNVMETKQALTTRLIQFTVCCHLAVTLRTTREFTLYNSDFKWTKQGNSIYIQFQYLKSICTPYKPVDSNQNQWATLVYLFIFRNVKTFNSSAFRRSETAVIFEHW